MRFLKASDDCPQANSAPAPARICPPGVRVGQGVQVLTSSGSFHRLFVIPASAKASFVSHAYGGLERCSGDGVACLRRPRPDDVEPARPNLSISVV